MLESYATIIDTRHSCFKIQQKPSLELELNSITIFSMSVNNKLQYYENLIFTCQRWVV